MPTLSDIVHGRIEPTEPKRRGRPPAGPAPAQLPPAPPALGERPIPARNVLAGFLDLIAGHYAQMMYHQGVIKGVLNAVDLFHRLDQDELKHLTLQLGKLQAMRDTLERDLQAQIEELARKEEEAARMQGEGGEDSAGAGNADEPDPQTDGG